MAPSLQSKVLSNGIRAITAGQGTPVILLPGWPQTAEAWNEVIELLSKHYRCLALDPPGLGESAPSPDGYDTQVISQRMADAVHKELNGEAYHLVGHDVGGWIAYSWAAQYPDHVKTVTIMDCAVPGLGPAYSFPLSNDANRRLWQFSFNALPDLPEMLTRGREREFFNWHFDKKTARPGGMPKDKLEIYIRYYSVPEVMSCGFEYYRAVEKSSQQNRELAKTPLQMPALGLGGSASIGTNMIGSLKQFAANVSGGAIDDCGHFLMEEQPDALAQSLLEFLAKHSDQ